MMIAMIGDIYVISAITTLYFRIVCLNWVSNKLKKKSYNHLKWREGRGSSAMVVLLWQKGMTAQKRIPVQIGFIKNHLVRGKTILIFREHVLLFGCLRNPSDVQEIRWVLEDMKLCIWYFK